MYPLHRAVDGVLFESFVAIKPVERLCQEIVDLRVI